MASKRLNEPNKTLVDATHPFFKGYENTKYPPVPQDNEIKYFCKECQTYFPMRDTAVNEHFQKRTHRPIDSCVYCQGPVCEYFLKGERLFFHNCEERSTTQTTNNSLRNILTRINVSRESCEIS